MSFLPSGNIFRELQVVHDTGYFSAQPSLEDRWQQVLQFFLCISFFLCWHTNWLLILLLSMIKQLNGELVNKLWPWYLLIIIGDANKQKWQPQWRHKHYLVTERRRPNMLIMQLVNSCIVCVSMHIYHACTWWLLNYINQYENDQLEHLEV